MPHLLHLDSGADPEHSVSRALTRLFADHWTGPRVYRDLHADPVPHLEHSALHHPESARPAGVVPPAAAELQQKLLAELSACDVLLIGSPLHNYSLASSLKAWIDRIHIPGLTTGPGTMPFAGKRAVVVTTRGLTYDEGPTAGWDHALPVLDLVLGTALGMEVEVVKIDYTLADSIPELAEHSATFHKGLDEARRRLVNMATGWSS